MASETSGQASLAGTKGGIMCGLAIIVQGVGPVETYGGGDRDGRESRREGFRKIFVAKPQESSVGGY